MLVEPVRLAVVAMFTVAGHQMAQGLASDPASGHVILGSVLGATSGYVIGGVLGRRVYSLMGIAQRQIAKVAGADIVAGGLGLIGGLIIASFLGWPLLFIPVRGVGLASLAFLIVVVGGLGYATGVAKREDILQIFGLSHRTRAGDLKVLDTSAILDARLLDCVRTGFLRGTVLVGNFVLEEVQAIADAADPVRRARGKRGLEALSALHREKLVDVRVVDKTYPEFSEVDAKVIALARERGASVVTNDVPLARIAELQGIEVLSLMTLGDAMRAPVVPGEQLRVRVVKAGREAGQGIGYHEDGSMVVVDGGRSLIGVEAEVIVTSVIQTSGGRMIFAKPPDAAASPSEASTG
jgi:uncharacterized protein YacL